MQSSVPGRPAPPAFGLRGVGAPPQATAYTEKQSESHTPVRGREGWPYGFAMSKLQEHRPQEDIVGLPRGTSAREHAHANTRRHGRE